MKLYSETKGEGPHLVLLHGWGMHGAIWQPLAELLEGSARLHMLDMPGYGDSQPWPGNVDLHIMTGSVVEYIDSLQGQVILLGWSLGGLVAMNCVLSGTDRVDKMVLLASTPCFTQREDWMPAMSTGTFAGFAKELRQDYQATLKRFVALQVRGSEGEKDMLRQMRSILAQKAPPAPGVLEAGLDILNQTDFRQGLHEIKLPVLCLSGARDRLVPAAASAFLADRLNASHLEIKKAGHAPFISHAQQCALSIQDFIHER